MEDKSKLSGRNLYAFIAINLLACIVLGYWLLIKLHDAESKYLELRKAQILKEAASKITSLDGQKEVKLTVAQIDSLQLAWQTVKLSNKTPIEIRQGYQEGVTFHEIVYLMLLAGSLGGVLCNLRGLFMHYRSETQSFPTHLQIPYYTRAFLGGGAGIFVYFVASFLITSVSPVYVATDVSFQGMVSFIALSMLAGFGSLEFFQRLKETALATFGQKPELDKWQRIEELYGLMKKEVLSPEEYLAQKSKILEGGVDYEVFRKVENRDE
jgi:hypothetical protein